MDAEEYIAQYGANLTDAEKRYIRAFGPPQYVEGPSRRPTTPGSRVVDAPTLERSDEEIEREAQLHHAEDVFRSMRELQDEADYEDALAHGEA